MTMTAFDIAAAAPWAMLPDRLQGLLEIAAREHEATPEALEAYRATAVQRAERATQRDGVGILHITGPLFKRANLFVEFSGATSYEIARRDLQALMDDPAITSVMIAVDSPGGEVNGCDELAAAIYGFRGKKPMTAFVSGLAASGGYWIASAADRVVVSDASMVGSIGVVMGVTDTSVADEKRGVRKIEFVSSQSPGKRPDIASDAGKARIQRMVDDLAAVFISAVAKHRGVSAEKVAAEFGAGGVEIAANAVALGMADAIGSMESEISALRTRAAQPRTRFTGGFTVSDTKTAPAADAGNTMTRAEVEKMVADASAKAYADATARVSAINAHAAAPDFRDLAAALIGNSAISAEAACALLDAAAKREPVVEEAKAAAPATPELNPATFAQAKAASGSLSVVGPAAAVSEKSVVAAGWAKAMTRAGI